MDRPSRYTSREQALPNSTRRIARANQRKSLTSQQQQQLEDDDHHYNHHRHDTRNTNTTRNHRVLQREKKREKEKQVKELHDLIVRSNRDTVKSSSKKERSSSSLTTSNRRVAGQYGDKTNTSHRQDVVVWREKSHLYKKEEVYDNDEIDQEVQEEEDQLVSEDEEISIDEMDYSYNHTTTYYDEDGNNLDMNRYDDNDDDTTSYDLERRHRDSHPSIDMDSIYEQEQRSVNTDVVSKASDIPRSNSPEINTKREYCNDALVVDIVSRRISSDPPTASCDAVLEEETTHHGTTTSSSRVMDPNEEIGSVYRHELELDAPPSPKGPELRRPDDTSHEVVSSSFRGSSTKTATKYTNYTLDDVGRQQYKQVMDSTLVIEEVRKMKVQQDPPESNRGLDVPAPRGPRVRSSRQSGRKHREEKKKKKKKPELKSILKKKGSPPVVSFFGKSVNHSDDEVSSGSEPEVTETKQGRVRIADENGEDTSAVSKSGMKHANINNAAGENSGESDDGSKDDSVSVKDHSDDESSDDATFQTIMDSRDERFDRHKTYYLRTSDLGLTQDTIFAEQFLDDPKSKAEPHYHHPSPHPPPNIQFHFDENYVAINDGKGGHSPLAPQVVDALVSIGYRTAADPVMWTPSSKTRKYMTERGLRFGDVPLPGPLDEGEGGPNDSNCMVWSGKFSHKYYGHDLLAIRSQGVINMSAEDLVDLLMDSDRIQEYNKSSNGRTDEIVLSDGTDLDSCPFSGRRKKKLTGVVMDNTRIVDGVAILDSQSEDERSDGTQEFDDDGNRSYSSTQSRKKQSSFVGVTKVVRSVNVIPLVKKKMDFVTLVHCRALTDDQGGNGYIIVGRNVYPADDAEKSSKGMMRSEVLLNVHIIRKFKPQKKGVSSKRGKSDSRSVVSSTSGQAASARELANRCLMTNVSHLKSPMIPSLMAKKMGSAAAASFINDIRALTDWY